MTRLPAARPTRHDEETAQRLVITRCDRLVAAYPALQWLYHPAPPVDDFLKWETMWASGSADSSASFIASTK